MESLKFGAMEKRDFRWWKHTISDRRKERFLLTMESGNFFFFFDRWNNSISGYSEAIEYVDFAAGKVRYADFGRMM